jgi:hypothetical protein
LEEKVLLINKALLGDAAKETLEAYQKAGSLGFLLGK